MQRLRELDQWAMSPQAVRPLAAATVGFVAVLLFALLLLTDLSPWLLVLPTIGFTVSMVKALRRSEDS